MNKKVETSTGLAYQAAKLEWGLVRSALRSGDREQAWQRLNGIIGLLSSQSLDRDSEFLYVNTCLEFSNLCFVLGKGFNNSMMYLQSALKLSEKLGDGRSRSLINLHLGRIYYFAEQRDMAIDVFEKGKAEVEEIGDEDILDQAAEFIGLYFFIQGLFQDAQPYFERAVQSFETSEKSKVINPSGPMWVSYCYSYLGQFHLAIGTLDYYRRIAVERSDKELATTLRSVLGLTLVRIKKYKEAVFHLSGALQEAEKTGNILASYFAKGGLCFHHLSEGRIKEARDWLIQTVEIGASSGIIRQYASPILLETLFEFHIRNIEPIPQLDYHRELTRMMQEPNIHLKGVALRLKAQEIAGREGDSAEIRETLELSESCLKKSQDPVQLSKTRLELARLSLRDGDQITARRLAQFAWKGFSGYNDEFFPDDLRHLLTTKSSIPDERETREELMDMFMNMIQDLVPSTDIEILLSRTLIATNRFFGAERGGIFWFEKNRSNYQLRASYNLSLADVDSERFKSSLASIFKAIREGQPQIVRFDSPDRMPYQVKAVLCIPFGREDGVQGVLYHDNSYVDDCFDQFEKPQLARIAHSLDQYVSKIINFCQHLEQKTRISFEQLGKNEITEIVTESSVMLKTLAQADQVAASESTVLILGETGVGKELLARRIHHMSSHSDGPLVIVEPSTIPENLVESELFGHEKGSFTGADRLKIGRLELAHQGTLFIDEVGEIPASIQVKLLRALQEKTMIRVGGSKTITSEFRLIAATNRNLAEEVAAGRFREDLYYRLNVIPIIIPALRERENDILMLADHFLARFAAKNDRPVYKLTEADNRSLLKYNWPGNIRELKNVMERTSILLSGSPSGDGIVMPNSKPLQKIGPFTDKPSLDEIQRRYIKFVLDSSGGKLSGPGGACEILGMKRSSLYNRMKKLGLR